MIAAWSPIARPVRGSALRGISGTSWPGRMPASALSRSLQRLGVVQADQHAAQVLVDRERGVGGGVDAAGDAGLDLPEGDLVGDQDRRPRGRCRRPAGRRRPAWSADSREPSTLSRVRLKSRRVLEDGAGDDLAELLALQPEAGDQPVERRGEHVLVGRLRVGGVGAGERDAVAADDRGLRVAAAIGDLRGRVWPVPTVRGTVVHMNGGR